jgi:hypothetical protein
MLGSALKTEFSAATASRRVGPTLSRLRVASGTAKARAKWPFVPCVPVVPPYSEFRRRNNWESNGRGIVGDPALVPGQVGQTQQSRGFQGETAPPISPTLP